jgi:hypothetical protein
VNCSDHGNNVCVHDQIELSVEKLQQDPLVSFSSFPVEVLNVEKILGQQLFLGLQIDNDVSVEEIYFTSFWKTQIKVSENFVLSSNLSPADSPATLLRCTSSE